MRKDSFGPYWHKKLSERNATNPDILVCSITNPIPLTSGGARAVANTILPLADSYNYHLLIVGNKELERVLIDNLELYKKFFKSVSFALREEIPKNFIGRLKYFSSRLLHELPFLDINFYTPASITLAKSVIETYEIKILELHTSHVAFFKYFFPTIPAVLLSQNIECNLFPFFEHPHPRLLNIPYNFLVDRSRKNSKNVELYNCWKIEELTFVTKEDAAEVFTDSSKTIIPVSFPKSSLIPLKHEEFNLTWIGTFDWSPNLQSMEWFAEEVFPLIEDLLVENNIFIHVIGSNPSKNIKAMARSPNVKIYGFVENLDCILQKTDLCIAPITAGAGIKVKVIEAMSHGIPTLGTKLAFIGTSLVENNCALIAENGKEFKKVLLDVTSGKVDLLELRKKIRKIFSDNFSESSVLIKKNKIYERLLQKPLNPSSFNQEKTYPLLLRAKNKLKRKFLSSLKKQNKILPKTAKDSFFSPSPYRNLTPFKSLKITVFDEDFSLPKTDSIQFSVLICLKNEFASIATLLENLSSQSLLPTEYIFIDHLSTDGTFEYLLNQHQLPKSKVKIFSSADFSNNNSRTTLAQNRNYGLQACSTNNVLFLDAGNEIPHNFFLNLVAPVINDETIELVGAIYKTQSKELDSIFTYNWNQMDFSNYLPACRGMLIKKDIAIKAGGFLSSLTYACEDVCFDIAYRNITSHWAFNKKAVVTWTAPNNPSSTWNKFYAYGLGIGESGFGDFKFYADAVAFKKNASLSNAISSNILERALFFGYLAGKTLRGNLSRNNKLSELCILVVNLPLEVSPSSRNLVNKLSHENKKILFISLDDCGNSDKTQKTFIETPFWYFDLLGNTDSELSEKLIEYSEYFAQNHWTILTDPKNTNEKVSLQIQTLSKKIKNLFGS